MEYISAGILALICLAIILGMVKQARRKAKMDAMVKETQKLCKARLRKNMKGGDF